MQVRRNHHAGVVVAWQAACCAMPHILPATPGSASGSGQGVCRTDHNRRDHGVVAAGAGQAVRVCVVAGGKGMGRRYVRRWGCVT